MISGYDDSPNLSPSPTPSGLPSLAPDYSNETTASQLTVCSVSASDTGTFSIGVPTMTPSISGGRGNAPNLATTTVSTRTANVQCTQSTRTAQCTQLLVHGTSPGPSRLMIEPLGADTPREECLQWIQYTDQLIRDTKDEATFFRAIYRKARKVMLDMN